MDTELDILIRAISDEKSADEATKQLVNRVFSKLKDGAIKLPINSKLDKSELKKLDDNVKQARKEVVNRYNKLQKEMANPEGFDAFSEKAINELFELGKAYAKFNSKASGQSKNSTKAISDVKATLGEVFQLYENELKLLNSKIKELNLQDKVSRQLSSTRSRRSSKSAEAYDRYLEKQEQHSKRAEGAGKRKELFNELDYVRKNKSPGSLGNRTIHGVATSKTLLETEYSGAHRSPYARQMSQSRWKAKKGELESLRVRRDKQAAEQRVDDLENGRVKYDAKQRVETRKPNGQIDISYEDTEVYNKKPKHYTNEENSELKRDVATNELAKILGGIEHQRKDVSVQLFKDYMAGAFAFNKASGNNEWKVIQETLEKTLNRYRGDKGTLGVTDGTQKGVFGGHAEAVVAIKEMLTYMKEIAKQSEEQNEVSAENARQLKQLAKIDPKAADKFADELIGKPNYKKSNSTVETNSQIAKDIKNELNKVLSANEKTFAEVRKGTNATNSQTTYDKIENVREAVADSNEQKTSKLNSDINRDVARAVKKDVDSGFNTDANASLLIDTVKQILKVVTPKKEGPIELPTSSDDLYKKLTDATRLALPKPDGRRKKISNGLTDENPLKKTLPVIQKSMSTALAVIPGEFAKTVKEAIHPTDEDFARYNSEIKDKRRIKEQAEYDAKLRRLADEANARKEAKKEKGNAGSKIPKIIVPEEPLYTPKLEKSHIYASPFNQGFLNSLRHAFDDLTGATERYADTLKANADDQDAMAAERVVTYGLNNGRNPNDTGDIAGMRRILQLYRTNKSSIDDNPELQQKIQLTKGREVDTTEVTKVLNKALSGPNMRNAQMGGSILRQMLGAATGFIGMPSLEKSRAQADGLNQVLGNVNKALQSVLVNIQTKETELAGMEERGEVRFDKDGFIEEGSSASYKLLADLEEEKLVLDTIQADLLANEKIIKRSGGNYAKMAKHMKFMSPVLRDNNAILRNITSGLDKNGKALKFQSRLAEILNYTFQLMSRSIGQMFKNWMVQLNPITQIKKAFNDFASYNPKWQRTMNVVKYNLRDIILPIMEKIAQLLVNMIGFADIILQKVQAAFGKTPISLFDQKNAQKVKETYEDMYDISAGFDELHDVGSSASDNDPNNLLGSIYKPELSQEWIDLAEKIGDLFAGIITGDLGFGEVMTEILRIAWQGITTLWKEIIWPFVKDTLWPFIKDTFGEILAWILGAFIAWKGLKLIGKLLWNAIASHFTAGAGINLLKNLFTDANGIVGIGRNLGTLLTGGIIAVVSAMALSDAINDAWNQGSNDAVTGREMNLTDKQTGTDALQGALGGAGVVIGGGMVAAALGASVALGPLVAVAAGVAALAAVVVVGAEAWAYHSKQNKIANNEMLEAKDYAEQTAVANERLAEVNGMVANATTIQNTHQQKLNQLEEEYGITLDYVNQKIELAGGNLSVLTAKERALYDQGLLTQESIDNYNRLLEIQLELQNQALWSKEQEAIALDIEAGNYELAALRIEQAELQGVITTEEATAKRIQLYKLAGEEERDNLLQNLTPEQRQLMIQYTNATDEELGKLAMIWHTSSESTRESLLAGVGPETQALFEAEMQNIDKIVKEHTGIWQGIGDTLAEVFTLGQADTWTYNSTEKYYKEGYGDKYRYAQARMESIQNDPNLTDEEKKARMQDILNEVVSFDIGTNYVPNDGLAYLHQGEAVIPKKYNQPYQPGTLSPEERAYMAQMMSTIKSLDSTMKQGISVNGQFVQRGSDLVAVVNRTKSQTGADLLSNVAYAR